jgi:hypothetical protein
VQNHKNLMRDAFSAAFKLSARPSKSIPRAPRANSSNFRGTGDDPETVSAELAASGSAQ